MWAKDLGEANHWDANAMRVHDDSISSRRPNLHPKSPRQNTCRTVPNWAQGCDWMNHFELHIFSILINLYTHTYIYIYIIYASFFVSLKQIAKLTRDFWHWNPAASKASWNSNSWRRDVFSMTKSDAETRWDKQRLARSNISWNVISS